MEIVSRFNVDEVVCAILRSRNQIKTACPICEGKGKILIANHSYACPECHGRKVLSSYTDETWGIKAIGRIANVRLSIDKDGTKEEYMLYSTGYPSGTVWGVSQLFATAKEAAQECERRNNQAHAEVDTQTCAEEH